MRTLETKPGSRIEYSSNELLFLSQTGQPYRGSVYVKFTSTDKTVNLLDFKKYITTLRQEKVTAENIARVIYDHISEYVGTDLGVVVDLTARGGILQTIEYGKEITPNRNKTNVFQI